MTPPRLSDQMRQLETKMRTIEDAFVEVGKIEPAAVISLWADDLAALIAAVERLEERPKHLASAMKKMLPPELYQQVCEHLDPLGTFEDFLRGQDR